MRKMSSNPVRGFTLLEVTVAMAILVIIAGSIFAVLRGTISEVSVLSEEQSRQQEIDGFIELCRKTFRMLPAEASLEGRVRQDSGAVLPEILIRKAPESLAWGKVEDYDTISVIGLRPQIGGHFSLGLLRVSDPKNPLVDPVIASKAEDWLTLIPDVSKIEWRYYDARSAMWMDILPAGSGRPAAIEMKLLLPGDDDPLVVVFWVVPIVPQAVVPQGSNPPAPKP